MPVEAPRGSAPRVTIGPSERLIVQDYPYIDMLARWCVPAWYDGRAMPFIQLLDAEVAKTFFPADMQPSKQHNARKVVNVAWPDPTPESLMVQVKVLSVWPQPMKPWQDRRRRKSIHWHDCMKLGAMPLEQGLPRAVEMLRGYVEDPAASLRERRFEV